MGSLRSGESERGLPHSHSALHTLFAPLHFGTGCDDLVEVLVGRRLAVAGEGDVVEAAEVGGDFAEFWRLVDLARGDQVERRA